MTNGRIRKIELYSRTLLYSMVNSAQYSVMTYMGKESKED